MTTTFCMALFGMIFTIYVANAADPSPLQDFCVGVNDHKSSVFVNGKFCKNPTEVTIKDFLYKGFNLPGNTSNSLGASILLLNDALFPAVNTLGISMARVDLAPYGLNTPHLHPRASEVFTVLEGTLYAGFVTTDNKLFDAVINKGDIIVFPQGLVHFQLNIGKTDAVAIAAFESQNPGRINVADAMFGTNPPIFSDVLTKAFRVGDRVVQQLQSQFPHHEDNSIETGRSILRLISQSS